jgi:hypothetical protein
MRQSAFQFSYVVQTGHRSAAAFSSVIRSATPGRLQMAGDVVPRLTGNLEQDGRLLD